MCTVGDFQSDGSQRRAFSQHVQPVLQAFGFGVTAEQLLVQVVDQGYAAQVAKFSFEFSRVAEVSSDAGNANFSDLLSPEFQTRRVSRTALVCNVEELCLVQFSLCCHGTIVSLQIRTTGIFLRPIPLNYLERSRLLVNEWRFPMLLSFLAEPRSMNPKQKQVTLYGGGAVKVNVCRMF
nr:hypothetical protein [Halomonas sp. 141]